MPPEIERWQKKQVCGSEGMVVGRAGTLLLCALAIILFCLFIGSVSLSGMSVPNGSPI